MTKTTIDLESMTRGFLECALWVTSCNGMVPDHDDCRGEDCDSSLFDIGYEAENVTVEGWNNARSQCQDFATLVTEFQPDIFDGLDASQVGHDLWLTSEGHGAGFWDRGLGARGDLLTRWAKTFSYDAPYVDDDDAIHYA